MPALAQKTTPLQDNHRSPTSAPRVAGKATPRRWHGDAPPARQSTYDAASHPDSLEVRELLSHFGHGEAARQEQTREELKARRDARQRARLCHRPFRMTFTAIVLGTAPLCLLASLLWLHSSALSLSRRDATLQDQISAARFDLERTRKEIATLNASPHIEEWARERGWQRATQKDFDQVPSAPSTSTPSEGETKSE